jgi:hypothetical protein
MVADIQPYLDMGLRPHSSGTPADKRQPTADECRSDDIATAAGIGVTQKEAGMSASQGLKWKYASVSEMRWRPFVRLRA